MDEHLSLSVAKLAATEISIERNERVYKTICNTLRGLIKGSHRATNLIMPSHQGNQLGHYPDNAWKSGFQLSTL